MKVNEKEAGVGSYFIKKTCFYKKSHTHDFYLDNQ